MRFGSLFSGIGGLDLGLERAGMECAWQVEIDEWCRGVLARHWPDVPRWDDAATFPPAYAEHGRDGRWEQLSASMGEAWRVDLICGGFPCQPVSLAGKRRGQDDERWLWPEFARIVRLLRPRYVLVENVPGLLARGMGDVLGDLAESGYDTEWDCIPAASVGASHLRYRVFIVAHAKSPGQLRTVELEDGNRGQREDSSEWVGTAANTISPSALRRSVPHAPGSGLEGWKQSATPWSVFAQPPSRCGWWATEPDVGRVAHGVPSRVDRLRGLGNAVVPQVAEWIGRRLMEMDS